MLDSLLGQKKMSILIDELLMTKDIQGDMAEIGVYKGGSAQRISLTFPDKKLYLYDTFKGIINTEKSIDKVNNGDFSDVNVDEIKKNMGKNVVFRIGEFPQTFNEHFLKFSFVHSDTDTYFGAQQTLKVFADKMSLGGKIIFDDWKWKLCPGIEKAIVEFLSVSTKTYKITEYESQFVINF